MKATSATSGLQVSELKGAALDAAAWRPPAGWPDLAPLERAEKLFCLAEEAAWLPLSRPCGCDQPLPGCPPPPVCSARPTSLTWTESASSTWAWVELHLSLSSASGVCSEFGRR